MTLNNHEDWVLADVTGKIIANGNGADVLVEALSDSTVSFAAFRLQATFDSTNVTANVVLQWKGPAASPRLKATSDSSVQHALDVLSPNDGFIQVWGKKNLTVANIYDRWRPGSTNRIIQNS